MFLFVLFFIHGAAISYSRFFAFLILFQPSVHFTNGVNRSFYSWYLLKYPCPGAVTHFLKQIFNFSYKAFSPFSYVFPYLFTWRYPSATWYLIYYLKYPSKSHMNRNKSSTLRLYPKLSVHFSYILVNFVFFVSFSTYFVMFSHL